MRLQSGADDLLAQYLPRRFAAADGVEQKLRSLGAARQSDGNVDGQPLGRFGDQWQMPEVGALLMPYALAVDSTGATACRAHPPGYGYTLPDYVVRYGPGGELVEIVTTEQSFSSFDARTRLRCPSCKAPMVGTSPTVRPVVRKSVTI